MYGRNILIAASLAMLTLSAPTPATDVIQRNEALVEHHKAFSLTRLVRGLLTKDALVEPVPDATYGLAIEQRSEEIGEDIEEDQDETEVDTVEEVAGRGITRAGGNSKRGITRAGGNSKRGITRAGGNSKRGITRAGGNSKRGITRPSGNSKRGITRPHGNSKRGLTGDASEVKRVVESSR